MSWEEAIIIDKVCPACQNCMLMVLAAACQQACVPCCTCTYLRRHDVKLYLFIISSCEVHVPAVEPTSGTASSSYMCLGLPAAPCPQLAVCHTVSVLQMHTFLPHASDYDYMHADWHLQLVVCGL